ncbi:MAG TPA: deoxyguanosinetriphosphate triphosphohydrolase, partial [Ruminiclostridium sp.]|nr:deoxyguanosinetriphosphate triphosphohydrolase [Ruminiclostridium sp.]
RRLKYKTQVFLSPEGDHYRTRLTHTLEVSQIARTIARALRINEDLTEAIALAHDIGHTPFGHAGERALNSVCPGGFTHYQQSLRVVDLLERGGQGLNLTFEVRNGIERHTTGELPCSAEGRVVRISDRIAYINHDIDDAIRGGVLTQNDLPWDAQYILGRTHSQRINTLITDLVDNSKDGEIKMSPPVKEAFDKLHEFMFESVYTNPAAKGEEGKAENVVEQLYKYFCSHPEALHEEYKGIVKSDGLSKAVCDYIAGMTDRYAVQIYSELFVPQTWKKS